MRGERNARARMRRDTWQVAALLKGASFKKTARKQEAHMLATGAVCCVPCPVNGFLLFLLFFDFLFTGTLKGKSPPLPPSVRGLDLNSCCCCCVRLGSGVAPPLGVVKEEVAVLIVLVRRHRRAVWRRGTWDWAPGRG